MRLDNYAGLVRSPIVRKVYVVTVFLTATPCRRNGPVCSQHIEPPWTQTSLEAVLTERTGYARDGGPIGHPQL